MTTETENQFDQYISENRSFALYRIPGETAIHFVLQKTGAVTVLQSVDELNEKEGFVIAPFRITPQQPIVLIRPEQQCLVSFRIEEPGLSPSEETKVEEDPEDYKQRFETFLSPLIEKKLDKLVLSRQIKVNRKKDFSPLRTFLSACEQYTRSYVYLFHTPHTGTWLGSTPEILLSGSGQTFHTVALAGTMPLQNGEPSTEWNGKNREEQQLVARYIREQLNGLGIQPEEKGPYGIRAARLSHLKSDFHFTLGDTKRLGDLLQRLHPTPAVAGLPKEEAVAFITNHEGYNRSYYSGFLGLINPAGLNDMYVNLRCMHIEPEQLTLYAGSGLLESSQPEEEWKETGYKLQTMLSLIK